MCNVGRVARAGAANLRERGQSGTVTRPSTIQCLHYNLLNIVARPPTVLCVYLLSTPNDSGRVVMRLDMVYAPSSINYNLYPPSYIPPSILTNFVYNCKKSQFVTSTLLYSPQYPDKFCVSIFSTPHHTLNRHNL